MEVLTAVSVGAVIGGYLLVSLASASGLVALVVTAVRMVCCSGWHRRGVISGLPFPIRASELTESADGPAHLTALLRHGGHLPDGTTVATVRDTATDIRDGVKGDKAILEIEYHHAHGESAATAALPVRLFAKFNLRNLGVMRLLVEASEVCRCEALFYRYLADVVADVGIPSPKCFFTDFNDVTGEFVLLSDVVPFGEQDVLPLQHRIRDKNALDQQLLFVRSGAKLNALLWGGEHPALRNIPRFDATHRQMWAMAQVIGFLGLRHTLGRSLKGRLVNRDWMTWRAPPGIIGREREIVRDMPGIMTTLCQDTAMLAFGHNDYTTDNAWFVRDRQTRQLEFGVFDWQQSCVNNVGQEWAWNLHFLEPEFLDRHEDEFISLILQTYGEHGIAVSRAQFVNAYVLGTVQMFVWSGGGLQMLLGDLHGRGLFDTLVPDDQRCKHPDSDLDPDTAEKMVAAEMTRRTFTNVCNIMARHDFVGAWEIWKQQQKKSA